LLHILGCSVIHDVIFIKSDDNRTICSEQFTRRLVLEVINSFICDSK
jgi:hypothetical protein